MGPAQVMTLTSRLQLQATNLRAVDMPRARLPCAAARMAIAVGVALTLFGPACADEGYWTFDKPPVNALKARYDFVPTTEWLDALRMSTLRLGGGSASFVSANGLVLTNHHVVQSCLNALSSEGNDLAKVGFLARTRAEERKCPGWETRRLESTEDVTAKVRAAVKSADDTQANAQRNAAIAALENECRDATGLRCEMVTLYRGGAYHLYRYRIWTDVRLVFAPESRLGDFGGDPDHFVYPRFALDVALMRVYDRGEPVKPAHYLKWAKTGVNEGDLVFAAGFPASTNRLVTLAQLTFDRDVRYPLMIAGARRQREVLQVFGARSPESARRAAGDLSGTENWLKALTGEYKSLQDPGVFAAKTDAERRLRSSLDALPGRADPWKTIEVATRNRGDRIKSEWVVGYGFGSLFDTAGTIVELANEAALPESERLPAYRASAVPQLVRRLSADKPIYKDLEIARLAGFWQEAIDLLGNDDPFVKRVLGGRTPVAAATAAIEGTHLDQARERTQLIDGGLEAIQASTDPLIVLARDVYPMRRRLAKFDEIEVETPILQACDELESMRFKLSGTDVYPDATRSLRIGYGTIRGYDADGALMPWRTNFWGLFGRSAAFGARPPFDLPERWIDKRRELDLDTPLDFVTTIDIIGGSSGSPVINRKGELVGLIFDINLDALANRYVYTDRKARSMAVDGRAIVEALVKVYGANALAAELVGPP